MNQKDRMYNEYEEELISTITDWLATTPFEDFYKSISDRVIGQPELVHVCANVYHYLNSLMNGTNGGDNMIIAAPSGSGKTETYRALHDYFHEHLPILYVSMFDTTQLSPSGFRGANKDDMLSGLFAMSKATSSLHPVALVFLDELDKKLSPTFDGRGQNVNAEIQNDLLTMLEGSSVVNKRGGMVYTDRVLFIGLGSFDKFRTSREKAHAPVGFLQEEEPSTKDHFSPVTRENMIRFGASHELLGRFSYIVNYGRLKEEDVRRIIEKDLSDLSSSFVCNIRVSPEFMDRLLQEANSAYGCRLIKNYLKEAALTAYEKDLMKGRNMITEDSVPTYLFLSEHNAFVISPEDFQEAGRNI